jgi:multisubunit Na+/H+ antiporter MnhB subunit
MIMFYILIVFVIIAALIAVETKNLLSAVICVGAVSFGGSLLFLFLRAPDIAITQIVVEVLGLIILIRATIARDMTFISDDIEFFKVIFTMVIIMIIGIAGIMVFETLPDFGIPAFTQADDAASHTYISDGLKETGAGNIVASVILGFRGYDTLGEATVLFTAITGTTVILRRKGKKKLDEPDS